jgi:hypothetical protein
MGEIGTRAGNGGNLGQKWVAGTLRLVGGRSVGDGDRTVVGFRPEMDNDGGRL